MLQNKKWISNKGIFLGDHHQHQASTNRTIGVHPCFVFFNFRIAIPQHITIFTLKQAFVASFWHYEPFPRTGLWLGETVLGVQFAVPLPDSDVLSSLWRVSPSVSDRSHSKPGFVCPRLCRFWTSSKIWRTFHTDTNQVLVWANTKAKPFTKDEWNRVTFIIP